MKPRSTPTAKLVFEPFLRFAAVTKEEALEAYEVVTGRSRNHVQRIVDHGPLVGARRAPGTREWHIYEKPKA